MVYDLIVIGSGPAGVSAAIYAKRSNLEVLMLTKNKSALDKAEVIENYYGYRQITGKDLNEKGIEQAKNLGVFIEEVEVTNLQMKNVEAFGLIFEVSTLDKHYETKTVVMATGIARNVPKVANLKDFENKGLSFCAVCDGFFYRNKDAYVLGSGNYAQSEAEELAKVAKSVTILTNGESTTLKSSNKIIVNDKKIQAFSGDERLNTIVFEDGSKLSVFGLFVAWGVAGGFDFAKKIGAEIDQNKIVVTKHMETTVPGFFACGDVTGGLYQIAKAVYEGAVAGLSVSQYLKNKKSVE